MKALVFTALALSALFPWTGARLSAQQVYSLSTVGGKIGEVGALDGAMLTARFDRPAGIAVDSAGVVYVVDRGSSSSETQSGGHIVRKISAAGVVTTIAGKAGLRGSADGLGDAARFNEPSGIAVDRSGNLYIADLGNHTIRKVTPAGAVTTLAGFAGVPGAADGTGSEARFKEPEGVAVDAAGNVYVADRGNYTIRKISPVGVVTAIAGLAGVAGWPVNSDGAGASARFLYPTQLAVDASGNVYVADYHTLRRITPSGEVTTLAGVSTRYGSTDGVGAEASFYGLRSVAIDAAGNIVVTDANALMRWISPSGAVTTIAGQARISDCVDGVGGTARISDMSFVAFDPSGNIWLADEPNQVIRRGASTSAASLPIVTTSPYTQSGTLVAGSTVRLAVVCSTLTPSSYQWKHDGVVMPLADGAILPLPELTVADTGTYVVTASNSVGSVSVVIGTLTVTPGPVSSLEVRHAQVGGSFLWGIAAGAGQRVAVGTGGVILASGDGATWTRQNSGTTEWLVGVCFGDGKFIAVGDHGTILSSIDGASWRPVASSGTAQRLNNVVYGHGQYVAVGEFGTIVTSADGEQWTGQSSGVTGWLRGLATSAQPDPAVPAFVAGGQAGILLTSPDGIQWQRVSMDANSEFDALTAVDNYASYVTVSHYGGIYEGAVRHPNMLGNLFNVFTWTRIYPGLLSYQRGLAVGANALFAIGDGGSVFSAPDTAGPWAKIPVETTANLVAGVFVDTTLYVVGQNETILASSPLYHSRLINISTRGHVGNDADTLISGFVVQGSAPKQVLLRAVGPALVSSGLTGVLAEPTLRLHNSKGEAIAVNSHWGSEGNAAELARTMERVGAFALPANSADAALLVTLEPGSYTAHVTGAGRTTGLALVEAYDADKLCNDGGKAINVSTRGRVELGQDRLIAGFVITGESARRVLIRAAGPGLAAMGVADVLKEPELTLFTARGNVIRTAAAWSNEPDLGEIRDAAKQTGAFPFAEDSKDSAFVITLPPAVYTVHVTGKNGATGVALVEVYDLP